MSLLNAEHNNARFVGGCVRDMLLGREYTDVDIATILTPQQVISRLEDGGVKTIPTGLQHGTVTAAYKGQNIEITTLRRDVSCDGRHAEVEYTDDWQQDATRRDFTMNSLYMDSDGTLHDYTGMGVTDARAGVVRFVGDAAQRIREDYLRIMRMFRFHAHYGKAALPQGQIDACRELLSGLRGVSRERVWQEFRKLLLSNKCTEAAVVMHDISMAEYITPSAPRWCVDVLKVCIKCCADIPAEATHMLRLSALTMPENAQEVDNITSDLKLSRKETAILSDIIKARRLSQGQPWNAHHRKAVRKYGAGAYIAAICRTYNAEDAQQLSEQAASFHAPDFPVKGADILQLGISKGRMVGELLQAAEDYWEESDYTPSKQDILNFIKEYI